MKKLFLVAVSVALFAGFNIAQAMDNKESTVRESQTEYERGIEAIVRNKHFYKAGKFELGGSAGIMPYDSLVNHLLVGGRATWHIHDHFAWEIADFHIGLPNVTSFTQDLAKNKGLSNLQTTKLKMLASTSFLLSPMYGKIRFFGRQILYFDFYFTLGGGMANTETLQLSSAGVGQTAAENIVKSGWDPMVNFGFGVKIFATDGLGLVIDLRDYLVRSTIYNKAGFKSNFSVSLGLSTFIPTF